MSEYMIENVAELLREAREEKRALGAFNVFNLETAHAVLDAAKETDAPVVVQFTESTMDYIGGRAIFHSVKNLIGWYYPEVRAGIHLDHGKSIEIIERCVKMGVPSVMYDGSRQRLDDNIDATKRAAALCHEKGVSVQGELGSVPYIAERAAFPDEEWDKYMTDPDEAKRFVEETGIDTLAVAIGNAHGMAKERSEPDYARLEKIAEKVSVPIVMHGASDWDETRVREVVSRGVSCFNVDTDSRMAFVSSLAHSLQDSDGTSFNIRKILGNARHAMKESVKKKIVMFRGG